MPCVLSASRAAAWTACHGVRSHARPLLPGSLAEGHDAHQHSVARARAICGIVKRRALAVFMKVTEDKDVKVIDTPLTPGTGELQVIGDKRAVVVASLDPATANLVNATQATVNVVNPTQATVNAVNAIW